MGRPEPPGRLLGRYMTLSGMTEMELASRIGQDHLVVSGLLAGAVPLTREIAAELDQLTGIPYGIWLDKEAHYRAKGR